MERTSPLLSPDYEKLRNDRLLFELYIKRQQEEARVIEERYLSLEAEQRLAERSAQLDDILESLDDRYSWMRESEGDQKTILTEAFSELHDFKYQGGTEKSSREVYIHFRLRAETDQEVSKHDEAALHLLDALLQGDFKNGKLPF